MGRARDLVVALGVLLAGRGRATPLERERVVPDEPPRPGWELVAIGLFLCGALSAIGFVLVYAFSKRLPHETQLLGATMGLAFVLLGAGLVVTAKHLVVTEELEEDYPATAHPEEQELVVQVLEEGGDRLTRRRLFLLALGGGVGAIGVAVAAPLVSLGPVFRIAPFFGTPWRAGRRLVDETGRAWKASDIEQGTLYTAFPEGANREEVGAPVVLVRLRANELRLPAGLAGYDADGIVAYSKICTHAGCAISLYRTPLFRPDEPPPGLVCPCHYSTFDPTDGGTVTFGPAGRKLPMLPLSIDRRGHLRARGNFDEAVGPSWWGVRLREPSP